MVMGKRRLSVVKNDSRLKVIEALLRNLIFNFISVKVLKSDRNSEKNQLLKFISFFWTARQWNFSGRIEIACSSKKNVFLPGQAA